MGSTYHVYVGPYIKCKVDRVISKKTIWSCSSDICDLVRNMRGVYREFPKTQKFCAQCGSPAADVTVDGNEHDAINSFTVGDITHERLCSFNREYAKPGVQVFIPNQDWPRAFSIEKGDDLTGEILRVSGELIEKEKAWLSDHFVSELVKVRALYGADRVEILWGVMGQYM